jgi:peptide-methionine (R)-S-oxide reductase|tara:strand:- start:245 stop:751 length:507 start_codon:yes stop_codon:yes gene_type:complete
MKDSRRLYIILLLTFCIFGFLNFSSYFQEKNMTKLSKKLSDYKVTKTDSEWKEILNDEEYNILREKGTEYPHSGEYNLHFEKGVYNCKGCNSPLFNSNQKFNSDCGWPSFDDAIEGSIEYKNDYSLGMIRVEILCSNCGGHLGHIFNDGPTNTGKRYCVNSVSLDFKN